jgi:hypothetical protein
MTASSGSIAAPAAASCAAPGARFTRATSVPFSQAANPSSWRIRRLAARSLVADGTSTALTMNTER